MNSELICVTDLRSFCDQLELWSFIGDGFLQTNLGLSLNIYFSLSFKLKLTKTVIK
jgi:hypothetical protein